MMKYFIRSEFPQFLQSVLFSVRGRIHKMRHNGYVAFVYKGMVSFEIFRLVQELSANPVERFAVRCGIAFKFIDPHSVTLMGELYTLDLFQRNIGEIYIKIYTSVRWICHKILNDFVKPFLDCGKVCIGIVSVHRQGNGRNFIDCGLGGGSKGS